MLGNRSRSLAPAAFGITLALALAGQAHADYVVNVTENGGDVIAVGSGTINTAGLTYFNTYGGGFSELVSAAGTALFGPTLASAADLDVYYGISGPSSFGPGMFKGDDDATSGTGDFVGISGAGSSFPTSIFLPENYVSGSLLNDSDTWSGQTFSSLGLTTGTYVWTWGSGADADSFTMNIGGSAVPEPASLVMLGTGAAFALCHARRRKSRASATPA